MVVQKAGPKAGSKEIEKAVAMAGLLADSKVRSWAAPWVVLRART